MGVDTNSRTEELNERAIRRLFLCEDYVVLARQVEELLDQYRYNISKTRTNGNHSPVGTYIKSHTEMTPSIGVAVTPSSPVDGSPPLFSLVQENVSTDKVGQEVRKRHGKQQEDGQDETKGEKPKAVGATPFRPFGVFESQSTRAARQNIRAILPLLCELATTGAQICELDARK